MQIIDWHKNLAAVALRNVSFVLEKEAKNQNDRFIFNPENNTIFFGQAARIIDFKQKAIAYWTSARSLIINVDL